MKANVRFHITVKGIVIYHKKLLILKRNKPSTDGLGYWELPGGGLEYKETPDETLIRELKEETGLDITILHLGYTFTKIRPDYQTIGIGYFCSANSDQVNLSDEHTDYKFIDIDDVKEYLHQDIYKDVIYLYNKYIKEVELL